MKPKVSQFTVIYNKETHQIITLEKAEPQNILNFLHEKVTKNDTSINKIFADYLSAVKLIDY